MPSFVKYIFSHNSIEIVQFETVLVVPLMLQILTAFGLRRYIYLPKKIIYITYITQNLALESIGK